MTFTEARRGDSLLPWCCLLGSNLKISPRGISTTSVPSRSSGHRDVSTTLIYAHVLNRGPAAVRSPDPRCVTSCKIRADMQSVRLHDGAKYPRRRSTMRNLRTCRCMERDWELDPHGAGPIG